MAQLTTRDYIWNAGIELAEETREDDGLYPTFSVADVRGALPDDVQTSDRTIRDTLNSMTELGHLSRRGGDGPNPVRYRHQ